MRRVSTEPLREAFERSDLNASQLADILGWTQHKDGRDYPDGCRVRRAVGVQPLSTPDRQPQQTVREDVALAIGGLLGLDPHELDL